MKKEIINDLENKKLIISFSPESAEECANWYDKCYQESLKQYNLILKKIQSKLKAKDAILVSHYSAYKKINLVEKKKGISGVYAKLDKDYQPFQEKLVEKQDGDHIFSISHNYDNLFEFKVPSLLCYINMNENILDYFINHDLQNIKDYPFKENDLLITFNDIGCDGNSIIILYGRLTFDLVNSLK